MITVARKCLDNDNGQAIMEFLIFLPFILMMYSVVNSLGNAINASINQQKITRGYFYYRLSNNSMYPRPRRDSIEPADDWQVFGMQINGWMERLENGATPVAPCFKFALPLGEGNEDGCDDKYTGRSSQFIRVKTVYGLCGATYSKNPDGFNEAYPREGNRQAPQHCVIIQ